MSVKIKLKKSLKKSGIYSKTENKFKTFYRGVSSMAPTYYYYYTRADALGTGSSQSEINVNEMTNNANN